MKYATIDSITKRLSGRITVLNQPNYGLTGVTTTTIGTDLIEILAEDIEEFVDMYLSMIYELPLVNNHPYLRSIVEKLIIAEIYLTYFPTVSESSENTDSFSSVMRQTALNSFQVLFNGLGIFVPGATNPENGIQNDETRQQMVNKPLILMGEKIKKFIGYDYDGDSITDSDLFKINTSGYPSFYVTGNIEPLAEAGELQDGVRVRPKKNNSANLSFSEEISFW